MNEFQEHQLKTVEFFNAAGKEWEKMTEEERYLWPNFKSFYVNFKELHRKEDVLRNR